MNVDLGSVLGNVWFRKCFSREILTKVFDNSRKWIFYSEVLFALVALTQGYGLSLLCAGKPSLYVSLP